MAQESGRINAEILSIRTRSQTPTVKRRRFYRFVRIGAKHETVYNGYAHGCKCEIDFQTQGPWGKQRGRMLRWALAFFIVALVAGVFGFFGLAVAAAGIAKLLFFIFLVLFLVSLVGGLVRRV